MEAIFYLRKFIEDRPVHSLGRFNYSVALKRIGDSLKADEEFQKAMELSKNKVNTTLKSKYEWLEGLGFAQQTLGQHDAAISTYEKVIAFSPNSGWAYRKLAEIYLIKNNKEKALSLLRRAVDLMPQDLRTIKLIESLQTTTANQSLQ